MYAVAANPLDPRAVATSEPLSLQKFLVYSLILHTVLTLGIAASFCLAGRGPEWTSQGTETSAEINTVGPVAGIPLPFNPSFNDSKTADPSKDLFAEPPAPKSPPVADREPNKAAEKIPVFKTESPLPRTRPSKLDQPKTRPPDDAVLRHGSPPNSRPALQRNPRAVALLL